MTSASRIPHSVKFMEEVLTPDGGGGFEKSWVLRLETYAEFKHLRGSETALAGRLTGTHTQIMRLRANAATLAIRTTWKASDEKGKAYNIRDVTPTEDRKWVDVLTESGVNT